MCLLQHFRYQPMCRQHQDILTPFNRQTKQFLLYIQFVPATCDERPRMRGYESPHAGTNGTGMRDELVVGRKGLSIR